MASNETPGVTHAPRPPRPRGKPPHRGQGGDAPPRAPRLTDDDEGRRPERTCVLTRAADDRDALIRLALSPDGVVAVDVRAKAPGRGAWIGVDRPTLEAALAKGRLRGALARAFKSQAVTIPADLPDSIEQALARDALDRLGLEARSGMLATGGERIAETARAGRVHLLLHAADAATDGRRKLDQAWRVGLGEEGSGRQGLVIPAPRSILSLALGRENVVSVAVIDRPAAQRVERALLRWCRFIGPNVAANSGDDVAGTAGTTGIITEGTGV